MKPSFLKKEILKEPDKADSIKAWFWTEKGLYLLDQRKLPLEEKYIFCDNLNKIRTAIKEMVVRGAPAIGICSAIGFVIEFKNFLSSLKSEEILIHKVEEEIGKISNLLVTARPTAINLSWAVSRMRKISLNFLEKFKEKINKSELKQLEELLEKEALKIWKEDIEANLAIADYGKDILPEGGILTHCNTGALATGGYGTALGIIRKFYEKNKKIKIFVDETRPFLQGARLTAWELYKLKIPYTLISDNAAGFLMKKGEISAVIVGADRIAKNGDTANKIGTYSLAVLAKFHNIPFYVAAPSSTFDLSIEKGEKIPIEIRPSKEVLTCHKSKIAPSKAKAYNIAFDITPNELISAIITEKGIIYPPYEENIPKFITP
ncbi:Methylthioribose-1-phosphate isomerase [Thermodesulfobacterium geofontis OPF15]|jgi:methylthioribose-1-phosphate isomerase|uniref:Methylthioribose-1-phosphate isomerase n=1 Tax=Thermodesulfobacterium geofontis (strain OPF15) TaxID=795359 RepID=F8C3G6_THEGP|nr:S-methyl-5-thioribose-1-phosphate isomerase [Thermodesulfobacterium geofontis]AEH23596.1 Methylthioribose-1-phosphate isomerase [Thermodesulfobacterium geofontis OPF15]